MHITFSSYAQESKFFYEMPYSSRNSDSYDKSASLLSVGYGLSTTIEDNFGNKISKHALLKNSLAINAKYEKAISDEFGIGTNLAYTLFSSRIDLKDMYGHSVNPNIHVFNAGLMGYYHFNKLILLERLDIYIGLGLSYRYILWPKQTRDALNLYGIENDAQLYLNAKLGARYYIGNSFGFYGEIGYDAMSVMNIGITVSLGDKILGAKSKLKDTSKEEIEDSDNNEDEEMEEPVKNKKVKKTKN